MTASSGRRCGRSASDIGTGPDRRRPTPRPPIVGRAGRDGDEAARARPRAVPGPRQPFPGRRDHSLIATGNRPGRSRKRAERVIAGASAGVGPARRDGGPGAPAIGRPRARRRDRRARVPVGAGSDPDAGPRNRRPASPPPRPASPPRSRRDICATVPTGSGRRIRISLVSETLAPSQAGGFRQSCSTFEAGYPWPAGRAETASCSYPFPGMTSRR